MFVVDYNWNTRRYYLIGQIKAASNCITLIGVVSFKKKTYMFVHVYWCRIIIIMSTINVYNGNVPIYIFGVHLEISKLNVRGSQNVYTLLF